MACVESIPAANADSEMEEGEIIDELDDLSDISSEEEFLLRQRLQVLENYNNVLERKKAKRTSTASGANHKRVHSPIPNLSEISATEFDENYHTINKSVKDQKRLKLHHKQKRKKVIETHQNIEKNKEHKKKIHHSKKKLPVKVIPESSDESEDEYRNRRRKLANAVVVNKDKNDKSSLSSRLKKMLCGSNKPITVKSVFKVVDSEKSTKDIGLTPVTILNTDNSFCSQAHDKFKSTELNNENSSEVCELIDLSTDDDVHIITDEFCIKQVNDDKGEDVVDSMNNIENNTNMHMQLANDENSKSSEKDSDDDLELLRQHALKTKPINTHHKKILKVPENKIMSEDEDSDTAELRLICLKSALLKKAIEMKQKQKKQKRLSQCSQLHDDFRNEQNMFLNKIDSDNNTDIESVDMDIGSDGDEKTKNAQDGPQKDNNNAGLNSISDMSNFENVSNDSKNIQCNIESKQDELDEDEDLLRAKLLTSLSKNLPNLISPLEMSITGKNNADVGKSTKKIQTTKLPEEKRFIIKLGESDSEAEHEATKNLTKMHIKLSEQVDFQQKLDMFLKSTRMEVEKTTLPDIIQEQPIPKKPEKFVAKAVRHLPKSEQIEYKNLVKRMAELEKLKQSRQSSINQMNKTSMPVKETLKPRNVSIDSTKHILTNNLEEQIAESRKKIAEESAKMLKLKEEATKLSQKYKIVATELRNITTAITLNKKQQRSAQNCLTKIRLNHQTLLKRSSMPKHSKINGHVPSLHHMANKMMPIRLQKENDPSKEEYKNPEILKTVRVSIANNLQEETNMPGARLSIQVDVVNNKKVVKMPMSPPKDRIVDMNKEDVETSRDVNKCANTIDSFVEHKFNASRLVGEKGGGNNKDQGFLEQESKKYNKNMDDYKSPLQSLGTMNWEADPNAILCPFEVGGECKDPDCKYLHTNILIQ